MTQTPDTRPRARTVRGFRDIYSNELRETRAMLATIIEVYERYGFEPLEQPLMEYTDALGKFLPDQDRPNEGVFSLRDDDEQWVSLRYDLTAPLARFVAENRLTLAMPCRTWRQGWVFRNEKPGPGRYRQFMQFDADTVGSALPAADAEVCMMAADTLEALGIARGEYRIKINNRKLLDGFIETHGIPLPARLTWMRGLDKIDRLGTEGVALLLGPGRRDESGAFTPGAGLSDAQIAASLAFASGTDIDANLVGSSAAGEAGLKELDALRGFCRASGYGEDRIAYDAAVVRGLEYYTGAVFECDLLMEVLDEAGAPVRFGAVGGGGRYDDLIARFTGETVPATGISIGVSRLQAALAYSAGKAGVRGSVAGSGPVVVIVLDRDRLEDYQIMVQALRGAGIRAELYLGSAGMKPQMKYADRRNAPLVIIQGGDEKARAEVQIKDLVLGAELARGISGHEDYSSQRLAQYSVPEADLVASVQKALAGAR